LYTFFAVQSESMSLTTWCIGPQVQHMLNYFHRRGKLVYFGGGGGGAAGTNSCGGGASDDDDDELLQRLAIIDCSWFVQKVGRLLMTSPLGSRCTAAEAIQALADPATDNWLRQRLADDTAGHPPANPTLSLTGRWLLAALDRLEMCVDMYDPVSHFTFTKHVSGECEAMVRMTLNDL